MQELIEHALVDLPKHGMTPLILNPALPSSTKIAGFDPQNSTVPTHNLHFSPRSFRRLEYAWLKTKITEYQRLQRYWSELFNKQQIKIFVSHYKNAASNTAIADALHQTGGIMAMYQRSFESHSSVVSSVAADVLFSFSNIKSDQERQSDSIIKYHVATGILGDYRFSLLRTQADLIRSGLKRHGATHILAFFDENTASDGRWISGHEFTQENYTFLLKKIFAQPWLGLVIKPRAPDTLRSRLGPVSVLLEQAEATGRCHVIQQGAESQGWYPPALAALAADIAIGEKLLATTAGLEAALVGIPTLMVDREGWTESPLYQLEPGSVIFRQWEELWERCQEYWTKPEGIPGFGDWSSLLGEFDPFQDGRAAERMGSYLHWLIEGFQSGLEQETIMANAAERYCKRWGWDKITEGTGRLNVGPTRIVPVTT